MHPAEKAIVRELQDAAVYLAGAQVEPKLREAAMERLEKVLPRVRRILKD